MLKLRRIFKNYQESGSFNEQVNLYGFIDSHVFLTKTGDLGVVLQVRGELKKKLNRDLARLGQEKDDPTKKREVAERHDLQVVRGRIPVPDLRIEYETPEQGIGRVDLELSTNHYRPRQLAEKARAGFTFYTHREDASRLRRILDDRELTAEILSL